MKHLCFFKWQDGTTPAQQKALFAAWKGLPGVIAHCVAVSCGEAVRWKHGENRGFHAGLILESFLQNDN